MNLPPKFVQRRFKARAAPCAMRLTVSATVVFAAGLLVRSAGLSAAGTVDRCYADWAEASAIVAREALVVSSEIQNRSRALAFGDVVRMTLCEERGRFTYRLVVRRGNGAIETMTVDARRPF